jgi:hypothetical protein
MLKKVHGELEKISQEAREVGGDDPGKHHAVLSRIDDLTATLKRFSQSSVTKVSLAEAVRKSLIEILEAQPDLLGTAGLREGLEALRQENRERVQEVRATIEETVTAFAGRVGDDIRDLREHFEAEMQELRSRVEQSSGGDQPPVDFERRLGDIERTVAQASGNGKNGKEKEIEGRLSAADLRIAEIFERIESLRSESAGKIQSLGEEVRSWADSVSEDLKKRAEALEVQAAGGIEQVSAKLGDQLRTLETKVQEQEAKVQEHGAKNASAVQDLAAGHVRISAELQEIEGRMSERASALEASLAPRLDEVQGRIAEGLRAAGASAEARLGEGLGGLEAKLLERVAALEAKLDAATGDTKALSALIPAELSARLAKIEEEIPDLRAMEGRLRTQMEIDMDQVSDKVNALVDMVGRIQSSLPDRGIFDSLADRLDRLETRFRNVSEQLQGIEGAVPQLKSLEDRVSSVAAEVTSLSGDVGASGKEFQDAWSMLSRRTQEIQDLLRGTVERWNADRSNLRQRLVDIRDTVHDQLQTAHRSANGEEKGFWSKVLARPESGLKMNLEEWERFRIRLETVVQGLEGLLGEIK